MVSSYAEGHITTLTVVGDNKQPSIKQGGNGTAFNLFTLLFIIIIITGSDATKSHSTSCIASTYVSDVTKSHSTSYIVSPTFVMLPSPTAPHTLCPPTFVMLPSPTTLHTLCPPIFLVLRNPRALHTLLHLYFSCYQVPEHLIHCFIHICHVTKSHNTSFIVSTYISDVIKSQCISHITPPTFLMLLSSSAIHTHYITHISDVAKL